MLPVGHTHEDVDALMKGLSVYLRGHNSHSYPDYLNAIKYAYKYYNESKLILNDGHIDFLKRDWCSLYDGCLCPMKGHTDFRYFLFKKNPSDNPNSKIIGMWVRDEVNGEWIGDKTSRDNTRGSGVFSRLPMGFQSLFDRMSWNLSILKRHMT